MRGMTSSDRVARKRHTCYLCRTPIGIGDTYLDSRHFDGGTAWTVREHIACIALMHAHPGWWDADEGWEPETFAAIIADQAERS